MNIVDERLEKTIALGIEIGKRRLYGALLRELLENKKDSLTFKEIEAVFEEEKNNARKKS